MTRSGLVHVRVARASTAALCYRQYSSASRNRRTRFRTAVTFVETHGVPRYPTCNPYVRSVAFLHEDAAADASRSSSLARHFLPPSSPPSPPPFTGFPPFTLPKNRKSIDHPGTRLMGSSAKANRNLKSGSFRYGKRYKLSKNVDVLFFRFNENKSFLNVYSYLDYCMSYVDSYYSIFLHNLHLQYIIITNLLRNFLFFIIYLGVYLFMYLFVCLVMYSFIHLFI